MKKITITMATIAMLMTACTTNLSIEPVKTPTASNSSQNSMAQNTTTQNTQKHISDELLTGKWQEWNTAWRGDDNKPPVLQFEKGSIRLINGCNNLWTDYRVANGQLIVSNSVRSTRMACDENLMQIDSHISSLLRQGQFSLIERNDKLILQIAKDNAIYWFIKE